MLPAYGLKKLIEECAEVIHYAVKKLSYWETDIHPEDGFSFKEKIEDEIGDTLAAISYVIKYFKLNEKRIQQRAAEKYERWTHKKDTIGFIR